MKEVSVFLKTAGFISARWRFWCQEKLYCFFSIGESEKVRRALTTQVNIAFVVNQSICPTVEDFLFLCFVFSVDLL